MKRFWLWSFAPAVLVTPLLFCSVGCDVDSEPEPGDVIEESEEGLGEGVEEAGEELQGVGE